MAGAWNPCNGGAFVLTPLPRSGVQALRAIAGVGWCRRVLVALERAAMGSRCANSKMDHAIVSTLSVFPELLVWISGRSRG